MVAESFEKAVIKETQEGSINASRYDIPRHNRLQIELGRRPSLCDCSARWGWFVAWCSTIPAIHSGRRCLDTVALIEAEHNSGVFCKAKIVEKFGFENYIDWNGAPICEYKILVSHLPFGIKNFQLYLPNVRRKNMAWRWGSLPTKNLRTANIHDYKSKIKPFKIRLKHNYASATHER